MKARPDPGTMQVFSVTLLALTLAVAGCEVYVAADAITHVGDVGRAMNFIESTGSVLPASALGPPSNPCETDPNAGNSFEPIDNSATTCTVYVYRPNSDSCPHVFLPVKVDDEIPLRLGVSRYVPILLMRGKHTLATGGLESGTCGIPVRPAGFQSAVVTDVECDGGQSFYLEIEYKEPPDCGPTQTWQSESTALPPISQTRLP